MDNYERALEIQLSREWLERYSWACGVYYTELIDALRAISERTKNQEDFEFLNDPELWIHMLNVTGDKNLKKKLERLKIIKRVKPKLIRIFR